MLPGREPVPDRIGSELLDLRVLAEVAEQRHFEPACVRARGEAEERARHHVVGAPQSAKGER